MDCMSLVRRRREIQGWDFENISFWRFTVNYFSNAPGKHLRAFRGAAAQNQWLVEQRRTTWAYHYNWASKSHSRVCSFLCFVCLFLFVSVFVFVFMLAFAFATMFVVCCFYLCLCLWLCVCVFVHVCLCARCVFFLSFARVNAFIFVVHGLFVLFWCVLFCSGSVVHCFVSFSFSLSFFPLSFYLYESLNLYLSIFLYVNLIDVFYIYLLIYCWILNFEPKVYTLSKCLS